MGLWMESTEGCLDLTLQNPLGSVNRSMGHQLQGLLLGAVGTSQALLPCKDLGDASSRGQSPLQQSQSQEELDREDLGKFTMSSILLLWVSGHGPGQAGNLLAGTLVSQQIPSKSLTAQHGILPGTSCIPHGLSLWPQFLEWMQSRIFSFHLPTTRTHLGKVRALV